MGEFVHLHVHTEYSLLDGSAHISKMLDRCVELGMDSIAITDHGVMYGIIDFYKEAKARGIHPVIGCEVYIAPRSMEDKQGFNDREYAHLVLLAKNQIGYINLVKLVSMGFTEGFYYKPRIDYDILSQYSEGLIGLSACLAGDIPQLIIKNRKKDAESLAQRLNNIFGKGNFYLELQNHGIREQVHVNRGLVEISKKTGIPLVATNDIHYIDREDYEAHDVLLCIQTAKTVDDPNRLRFDTQEFYLKSPDEMEALFHEYPEAIKNSVDISKRCNVEFDFDTIHLPEFDVPSGFTPYEYLRKLCFEGAKKRYNTLTDKINSRLEFELETIRSMGYVDYFLIVWDFIKFARDNDIIVGPGRGSAAGSIVSYTLEITQIDPLKYNLLFERFLNPERVSMPDIDIDFCFERRQEVIDYVVEKYGVDRVAQIITFGTMAARAVIRDVGRALNIPYGDVDKIAKLIPFEIGMTIDRALEVSPELKGLYDGDELIAKLIDTSRKLEGLPRHASTHAAGVVIAKHPLTMHVPLQKNDECITTQFPMGTLEQLGLLKMDFLGLRTLTVIRDTLDIIRRTSSNNIDIRNIPLDDKNVYAMLSQGDTDGVFQLESSGMRQFLKELKPDKFEDIIAGISLYRPGPMDQIPRYIENKKHPDRIDYTDKSLAPILEVTYGCMVYQEQVMQIVRDLAGYSLGRSDLVRRAMAKKKTKVMKQERHNFIYGLKDEDGNVVIKGALDNGVSEDKANQIYDEMMEFAKYAFNKSHAAAYAMVAYQTAYLKYYYPVEFMAALMTSVISNSSKVAGYIQYCRKKGIEVLPPDVNESFEKFAVTDGKIRFGLAAVKNVGRPAIREIIRAREDKSKFESLTDFCHKIEGHAVNKRTVESLVKCGAFDSMKVKRAQLMAVYERTMDGITKDKRNNIRGQVSLFDTLNSKDIKAFKADALPNLKEFTKKMMLSMEKETVGVYITGHPLSEYKDILEKMNSTLDLQTITEETNEEQTSVKQASQNLLKDGSQIRIGGIITSRKIKATKNNNMMAFVTLEDLYGNVEVIVFPATYQRYSNLLTVDNTIVVKGKVSVREDEEPKILCDTVVPLNTINKKKLYLKLISPDVVDLDREIKPLLKRYSGNIPVYIYLADKKVKMRADRDLWVDDDKKLIEELSSVLGNKCVKMVDK